ncbi:MAG TPA: SRPBCC domain-containing protein [Xanthomonadales bacterium]|nr:SRPBCC domain-containing protein [Xanthomonadales bacterium]
MAYEFTGDFTVATPRDEVFAVLSQTDRFVPMLPTYVSHQIQDDGAAVVKVKVGVGKVRGTGEVVLTLEECVVPSRATYSGKGKVMGGVFNLKAGFELEEASSETTRVKWQGEMAMFGKLVSLAGGLVKPIAERDINHLIQALQVELGGAVVAPVVVEARPGLFARFVAWLKRLFRGNGAGNGAKPDSTTGPGDSGTPENRG